MNDENRTDMDDMTNVNTDVEPTSSTPPPVSALPPAWVPPTAAIAADTEVLPAPRIRWAAVVWGLALATIAGTAIWVVSDSERRSAVTEWMLSLSAPAAIAYVVLAIGTLMLVAGIVGLARRLQRGIEERRSARSAAAESAWL